VSLTPVAFAAAVAVAGLFVLAASYKTIETTPLKLTLRALNIDSPWAEVLSRAAPLLELIVAVLAIAVVPVLTPGTLLATAAVLAYAGVIGVRSTEPILCSCFGISNRAFLGRTQLMLSVALAAVALLLVAAPPSVSLAQWAMSTALVFSVVIVIRVVRAISILEDLRASRIALSVKYPA